jgi:hypothetical protein
MTFAVSITAATIFIETFYMSFFCHEETFANSVFLARKNLALKPRRPARFNTEVDLCDYFVPVVFSSTDATEDTSPRMARKAPPGILDSLAMTLWEMIPRERVNELGEPGLLGREDELAELEREFLPLYRHTDSPTNILLIHGMLGIGKSTFAEHVCWWWQNTGIADDFILVRINPGIINSPTSTTMKRLQRRLSADSVDQVVEILQTRKLVVLLDDLNHLTQWSPLTEDPSHQELKTFLMRVHGGKSIIALTSTSTEEEWIPKPFHTFKLNGLKDINTCLAIMTSVMDKTNIRDIGSQGYRSLEKIANLVSRNPAALRAVCWDINASGPSALENHYVALRRGVTNNMVRTWSSNMGGYTISQSAFKVKRFLEGCFGAPPDHGLLFLSLAMHAGRVHHDWIAAMARLAKDLWSESENSTAENWLETFHTITRQLQKEIGLLDVSKEDPGYYQINPLFTYMARIKIQAGGLGPQELVHVVESFSNTFHAHQCFSTLMDTNPLGRGGSAELVKAVEAGYFEHLNTFDVLLGEGVDRDATILPTLDDIVASKASMERLFGRLALDNLNDEETSATMQEFQSLVEQHFSNESALFYILQAFMMQSTTSARQPLTEETIRMCESYLERLGLDVSTGLQHQSLSQNLCGPVVTIISWLAQYWFATDLHKAQRYAEFGILVCNIGTTCEVGKQKMMYQIFTSQLLQLKAAIATCFGDEKTAKALNETTKELEFSDEEKQGAEDIVNPLLASLRVNASHALYNIALLSKTIREAEPEHRAALEALAKLAELVGYPDNRLDNSEDVEFTDLSRGIMRMWDMYGVSKSLGAKSSRIFYARNADEFALSLRQSFSGEELKQNLQSSLEKAIHTQDYRAAEIYHEELVECYWEKDDWRAACNQLISLEEMRSQRTPAVLQGIQVACLTPTERMMRDLRNGVIYLFGARLISSYQSFSKVVTRREDCHFAFNEEEVNTQEQVSLARRLIRNEQSSDGDIDQLCVTFGDGVSDKFKDRLLKLGVLDNRQYNNTVEDILETVLLGLDVYQHFGGLSAERMRQAVGLLVEGCSILGLGVEE